MNEIYLGCIIKLQEACILGPLVFKGSFSDVRCYVFSLSVVPNITVGIHKIIFKTFLVSWHVLIYIMPSSFTAPLFFKKDFQFIKLSNVNLQNKIFAGKWHQMHHWGALRLLPRQALSPAQAEQDLWLEARALLQLDRCGKHWHAPGPERSHYPGKLPCNVVT